MQHPIIKKTSKLERIFILAALIVFGLIIGSVLGLLYPVLTGCGPKELNSLRFIQICSQIFTFVLPPVIYAILVKEKPMISLGFRKTSLLWIIIGIALMYVIMPINSIFAEWNANIKLPEAIGSLEELLKTMQEAATEMMEKFVNVNTVGGLIINLFMIAGLAAIGEELLFRSVIQTSLIKTCKNVHIGIFLTSVIFSLIHFEFYGFIPRLVLGLLLGYMYFYTRSIWVPMAMHFVNNGTIVVLYYINNVSNANINIDEFGKTNTFLLISSIIATIALLWFATKKHSKEELSSENDEQITNN